MSVRVCMWGSEVVRACVCVCVIEFLLFYQFDMLVLLTPVKCSHETKHTDSTHSCTKQKPFYQLTDLRCLYK